MEVAGCLADCLAGFPLIRQGEVSEKLSQQVGGGDVGEIDDGFDFDKTMLRGEI